MLPLSQQGNSPFHLIRSSGDAISPPWLLGRGVHTAAGNLAVSHWPAEVNLVSFRRAGTPIELVKRRWRAATRSSEHVLIVGAAKLRN